MGVSSNPAIIRHMTKIRVLVFLSTLIVVGLAGLFFSYYARGYRLDFKTLKFQPNGILVLKSEPDGASVYINGSLKTATNATISLPPGVYDVDVKKDGYFSWYKRLTIEKEIVTTANVSLFRNVPSLSPVTFSGAENPTVSEDGTKIAYIVPPSANTGTDKIGLWTMETFSLPLGFTNEPKRVTDGDLTGATYDFSPDSRQILLTTSKGIFLLDSGTFTPQSQMVNIASQKAATLASWSTEQKTKNSSLIRNLPPEVADVISRKTSSFTFSPDENMVLYTASSSANLPQDLIRQLPGSSTQRQSRNIEGGHIYVYDIKEDRNFLISDGPGNGSSAIRWMLDSHHLLLAQDGQVNVIDYDSTNKVTVYSGSYVAPFAFPFTNTTKVLILTNLGGFSTTSNLYTLTVK